MIINMILVIYINLVDILYHYYFVTLRGDVECQRFIAEHLVA